MKKFLPMLVSNLHDYGVSITADKLEPMVRGDEEFVTMLFEIYDGVDVVGDHVMDTQDRDQLCDLVARDLTNMSWPLYGSPTEYKTAFAVAMQKAVTDGRIDKFEQ